MIYAATGEEGIWNGYLPRDASGRSGDGSLIPKKSKRTKTSKTPSDVCDSCRVCVLSVMALSVRTSSYANPNPYHITLLSQTSEGKTTIVITI